MRKTRTRQNDISVIKVGGAQLDDASRIEPLVDHIGMARSEGRTVIVVHGGGGEIADLHHDLGVPFQHKSGLRTTSRRSMDIVTMVLCGRVNKRVVAQLTMKSIPAMGISGIDCGLLTAEPIDRDRLGLVGGVPEVDTAPLVQLLSLGVVPVVAPVSLSRAGEILNVNADMAAQALAVAMHATCLEFVTDVQGIKTPGGVMQRLETRALRGLLASNVISGGMIPKVRAAMAAADGGVGRIRMGNYEALSRGTATEIYQ